MKPFLAIAAIASVIASTSVGSAQGVIEITRVTPPVVASTTWAGVAVSPTGRVFKLVGQTGEITARLSAKAGCERKAGWTCRAIAIPEEEDWKVVAIGCDKNGKKGGFIGASAMGYARDIAMDKAASEGFSAASCRDAYSD